MVDRELHPQLIDWQMCERLLDEPAETFLGITLGARRLDEHDTALNAAVHGVEILQAADAHIGLRRLLYHGQKQPLDGLTVHACEGDSKTPGRTLWGEGRADEAHRLGVRIQMYIKFGVGSDDRPHAQPGGLDWKDVHGAAQL